MALSIPGALSLSSSLNLTTAGNAVVFPMTNTKRLALTVNSLTGSGATLAIDGSRDGGITWPITGISATDFDLAVVLTSLADDSDYWVVTHGFTHVQVRVVTPGSGSAVILLVSEARLQRPPTVAGPNSGSGPNPAQDGTDPTNATNPNGGVGIRGWLGNMYAALLAFLAALGTPTDTPWTSGAGTLVALGKRVIGQLGSTLSVAISGMLPAGTNLIGSVATPDLLAAERPYQGAVAMVVGTAQPAQRAVRIACTAAGNVGLTYADGTTDTIPVNVGLSVWAGAVTTITAAATSPATATYANLK